MKYVSGRVKELKVGISSYTEEKTPFSVIGNADITGDIISGGLVGIGSLTVAGVSTFTGAIDANGDLDVDGHTELDNVNVSGVSTLTGIVTTGSDLYVGGDLYVNDDLVLDNITGNSLNITGLSTFGGTIDANGDLDVDGHTELDDLNVSGVSTFSKSVGITSDLQVTGIIDSNGQIVGAATSNIVPFLYSNYSLFPSATTYHGAVAHAHNTGKLYYAHGGNWIELVNKETNGTVGTGTEKYDIGITSVTNLYVSGISTYDGNLDVQSSVLITGITTVGGLLDINAGGQANTFKVEDLTDNRVVIAGTGGELEDDANLTFNGTTFNVGSGITMYQATGIISATAFYGDGSGLDNTGATLSAASGSQRLVLTSLTSGTMVSAATDADLSFDAATNLLSAQKLFVSGITTFNGVNNIFNGATYFNDHVYIGNSNNDLVQVNAQIHSDLDPASSGDYDLGNGTRFWKTVFLNNILQTSTGFSTLTSASFRGDISVEGNAGIGSLSVTGISTFNGTTNFNDIVRIGDSTLDTVQINAKVATNLVPGTTGVFHLGSSTKKWGDLFLTGNAGIGSLTVSGISTFSKSVGITSDLQVTGTTRLDGLVSSNNSVITVKNPGFLQINNDAQRLRLKGTGTVGAVESSALQLNTHFEGGTTQHALVATKDSSVKIYHSGNQKLETTTHGVVVTGITTADGAVLGSAKVSDLTDNRLVIAGTAGELEDTSKLTFDGSTLAVVGDANFTGDVTVQGTLTSENKTNIDSIGIVTARTGVRISAGGLVVTSGVATFTDAVGANGGLDVAGGLVANSAKISDLTNTRVVFVGTAGELQDNSGFTFNGSTVTAPAFSGDGSALTGITAAGTGAIGGITVKDEGVTVGTAGSVSTFDFKGATVTAIANTGAAGIATVTITTEQNQNIQTLNVSGISTFNGNINLISTDGGSSAAPEFKLYRNSATPANADYLGQIKFAGESSTGVERNYAKITGKILDSSNGVEDGILEFAHIKNGSQVITGRWRSDSLQLLNGTSLTVAGDVSATNFNSTSDSRLKTNVQTITSPLEKLNQIDGVSFDWVEGFGDETSSIGVIADTVQKVLPVLVAEHATGYKTVNYNGLIGLLIEAVKEQQVQITELKTKLDSLS